MYNAACFRLGRVSQRDELKCAVRVDFLESDGLQSYWLPVMQPATMADRSYRMPAEGEQVVCLMDERSEFGVVCGAIYSEADTPPIASLDRVHLAFGDGTTIDYDRAEHLLEIVACPSATVRVVADHVELGGAGGEQLVTKTWLENIYASHIHPTPIGATGIPVGGAAAVPPNVTEHTVAQ